MSDHRWIGAVCRSPAVAGPAAHLDAALLSALDGRALDADLVCTHVDRGAVVAEIAMSARVRRQPGEDDLAALSEALGGDAVVLRGPLPDGRCVRFPGQEALTGVLPAAEVVARSAIDEVVGVGVAVTAESSVDTRGFVRPAFDGGRLVLLVEPAAGGVLRPVEVEQPHECCGGH